MAIRTIAKRVPSIRTMEGEGFIVRRPFPGSSLDRVDPFLMLDEAGPITFAPGPFMMNSEAEIQRAIADFRNGRMGAIPGTRR